MSESQFSWFEEFVSRTKQDLCVVIENAGDRFPNYSNLLQKYDRAAKDLFQTGVEAIDHYNTVHNELCLAATILKEEPLCQLGYELPFKTTGKKFDFRVVFPKKTIMWIEVKTIQPQIQNDWDKYTDHDRKGYFPSSADLVLSKTDLGGELYHFQYSARSKILEYTLETEDKIRSCLAENRCIVVLALFSNGLHWCIEDLEDFVFFYRNGEHYPGDHFSLMETKKINKDGLILYRNINYFTFVKRRHEEVRASKFSWNVKPPKWPP